MDDFGDIGDLEMLGCCEAGAGLSVIVDFGDGEEGDLAGAGRAVEVGLAVWEGIFVFKGDMGGASPLAGE